MRSLQVVTLMLCLLGGLYLLTQAPSFFMPARWDPAIGHQFDAHASRLLGAGLLALVLAGLHYMKGMYYGATRTLPGAAEQRRYFVFIVLALGLIVGAFYVAEAGPNPDYRPPAHQR
ncbi:MAG: hypothetical protein AB7S63_02955 [Thauera sp.]|jgi:hypothetical protein